MSRFTAIKMSEEVVKHHNITKKDYLFGLVHNVTYTPTQSEVESYSNFYDEENAKLIKSLIETKAEDLERFVEKLGEIPCTQNTTFRLDLCISHDNRFIAMQLNHIANDITTHITPIRYFEGDEAAFVERIFC